MTVAIEIVFDDDPCIPVVPVAPAVTPSVCPPGSSTVTRPTLTLPTTTGITYTVDPAGPYSGGQTVTVTAALQEGYAWGELPAGWVTASPTATFVVTLGPDAECPKAPVKIPPKSPPLAVTGPGAIVTYAGLAGLALLVGAGLMWVSCVQRGQSHLWPFRK
ncbi:hypothetical protein [Isoptericola variabilis]|uniref:Uncharacterized protein n=1 Tax=Isoptericola variabilis (strain 225) TaxID=743718 RepID=F6FVN9_ISOV2|nr:hypothetical protein [Isoptericola variabilis]AEG45540.1 hypothetical protein Isova_2854 [Isoptericola variabilis 225]TWH28228.1 hypothetical protein L600_004300000020 [Isoptericola variabilis J7]